MINVEAKVELSEKGTEGEGKRKKEGERKGGGGQTYFFKGCISLLLLLFKVSSFVLLHSDSVAAYWKDIVKYHLFIYIF